MNHLLSNFPIILKTLSSSLATTTMKQPNPKRSSSNTIHLVAPLFISFLLHLTIQVAADSFPYVPVENIALDCGSLGGNHNGRSWIGDTDSPTYSLIDKTNTSFTSNAKKTPTYLPSIPYSSAHISTSEFTYSFLVTTGPKFIRLYFYPSDYQNFTRADAIFAVKSGSFILLDSFSAALTADSLQIEGFSREFCVLLENSQKLNLTFTPSTSHPNSYAFINGIEVVSMPDELYYKPVVDINNSLNGIGIIGEDHSFYPYSSIQALELIRRLNVGGKAIGALGDTGMYRTWEDDSDYVISENKGFIPANLTIALDYEKILSYTAPKDLYITARTMGNNKTKNYSYNLTWGFVVDSGFNYLVRLHFCEFISEISYTLARFFKIYIGKQLADGYASVILWSGGNGKPIYQDYVVFMSDPGKTTSNLDIALYPNPESITTYSDAILNGIEIFKIAGIAKNLATPDLPPEHKASKGLSQKTIVGIATSSVLGLAAVLVLLGFFLYRKKEKRVKVKGFHNSHGTSSWRPFSYAATTTSSKTQASSHPSDLCRRFSLAEIKTATKNFDDVSIIGVGGFGNVYKGHIDGGSTLVAIKRLNQDSQQGKHEFLTEIVMLSQLRHLHLVSLIGYCDEQGEMILIYDYMTRGALRDHLYNTTNPPLPWKERLRICIGAARGLDYLHRGAKYSIIHRDMKTTNILLDENWAAKVSDFGLSRVGPTTASNAHISTAVKGTFGYLDPEYFYTQRLTEKSDVYSFGVVLLEVLCARPAVNRNAELEEMELKEMNLALWAKSCCRKGAIDQIIDPHLMGKIAPECLRKFFEIALSCIKDEGCKRPSMNDVVQGLEFLLRLQETAEQGGSNEEGGVATTMIHDKDSTYMFSDGSEEVFLSSDAK